MPKKLVCSRSVSVENERPVPKLSAFNGLVKIVMLLV